MILAKFEEVTEDGNGAGNLGESLDVRYVRGVADLSLS